MKKTVLAAATVLALMQSPLFAGGKHDTLPVTFASIQALEDKKGNKLDGSVKFYFADEKAPAKGGEIISSHGNTSGLGRDKEGKCRWALLGAFLKFQERAKREGMTKVVDVKTSSDSDQTSGARDKCLCAVGNVRVGTTVTGRLAK